MPKYYINDGRELAVVSAKNPLDACVKAIKMNQITSVMVNGTYSVSQRGFNERIDDDSLTFVFSDKILDRLLDN